MPYLCLWRRNFCVTGECFFSYSGAIFERSRSLFSLPAAAQNMHVFLRKSPLFKEHFFGWLKTANISIVCGTATLKSLLSQAFFVPDVHPRPRKRPPRCTLDCGFKTSESPALRGFVAGVRALATAALYLVLKSNGLRHSKILPVKFGFSLKTVHANIAKKSLPQCCSKPLFIAFSTSRTNGPHSLSRMKSGTHATPAPNRAHSGLHAETGAFRTEGAITTLGAFRTFTNIPGPGIRTANFATFGSWSGVLPKNAESQRNSDALMRVAVPRRRGPAGLRNSAALASIRFEGSTSGSDGDR